MLQSCQVLTGRDGNRYRFIEIAKARESERAVHFSPMELLMMSSSLHRSVREKQQHYYCTKKHVSSFWQLRRVFNTPKYFRCVNKKWRNRHMCSLITAPRTNKSESSVTVNNRTVLYDRDKSFASLYCICMWTFIIVRLAKCMILCVSFFSPIQRHHFFAFLAEPRPTDFTDDTLAPTLSTSTVCVCVSVQTTTAAAVCQRNTN
jgi:hypothetical protein